MKKIFLPLLLLMCSLFCNACYTYNDYMDIVNPLNLSVSEVEQSNNVIIDGIIQDPGNGELSLYFKIYQHTTIDNARRLYIKIVEGFVQNMHRTSLSTKITSENVNIYLSFFNKQSNFHTDQSPAAVMRNGDKIVYLYDKGENSLEVLYEESYEDAVSIVHSEKGPQGRQGPKK